MAAIAMPAEVVPNSATIFLREFSAVLTPFLGGPEQLIDRPGTRFGVRLQLPSKRTETEAMIIQSRLLQARKQRLIMPFPQPGFDTGNPGAPVLANAVLAGTVLPLTGLAPGYVVAEGQFFSIIRAGRRYLHMFRTSGTAAANGSLIANIFPMLRVQLSAGDVVEIAQPMIEGLVSPGDELNWQISVSRLAAFSFTISEGA